MSQKRFGHALEYGAFRALSAFLRTLPERWALGLGAALGWFVGGVAGVRRQVVSENLRRAFPEQDEGWRRRVGRASWAHLGREAVAMFRMADMDRQALLDRADFSGLEEFRDAYAEGNGVVLVSGHLGNWEIGGASLAATGLPVDAVAKGMANARFDADLVATRERLGLRVVDMSRAPREVLRSLRAGHVAGLVADQNMHRGGIFVPFFDVPAATARGPALFALRAGAPLFLGAAIRKAGWPPRYRAVLKRIPFTPGPDLDDDVVRLTSAHVAALEELVREAPEQYFWQHKRWKTRPPEEQASEAAV